MTITAPSGTLMPMTESITFVLITVGIAYLFDFINGFHDAANSIATIVATKVLTPLQAVCWAAFFNFIAFLFFKLSVATMIGTGLVMPNIIDPGLIFAALVSAIVWNLITWYYGLPSSSSHALLGGLAGAAYYKAGWSAILLSGYSKVLIAIVISPLMGGVLAWMFIHIARALTKNVSSPRLNKVFSYLQLASSAGLSLSHGGNDAQKTMGIIAILLFSSSLLSGPFHIPFWVVVSCNFVIALGTLAGGWRIVKTVGKDITELNTMSGSCAESSAAITIAVATYIGIPVSTTHTVTGSVTGIGISKGRFGTQWAVIYKIVNAWFFTLPVTFVLAAVLEKFVMAVLN